jgi:hypothetical protein
MSITSINQEISSARDDEASQRRHWAMPKKGYSVTLIRMRVQAALEMPTPPSSNVSSDGRDWPVRDRSRIRLTWSQEPSTMMIASDRPP